VDAGLPLMDDGSIRNLATGFHFTNEILLDEKEGWLYVA